MSNIKELKKIELFSEFSNEELEKFSHIITVHSYRPGDMIFSEGDTGDSLYVVKTGKVQIKKMIDWKAKRDKVLAVIGKGSFFGDMALYSGELRSAFAYSLDYTECYRIASKDYMELMRKDPNISFRLSHSIIKILGDRLRNTSRDVVVFFDTGKLIGETSDLNKLLSLLLLRLKEILSAKMGFIALYNDLSGEIEIESFSGFSCMPEDIDISSDSGIIGKVFGTIESVISKDIKNDDEKLYNIMKKDFDINSVLCIPLIYGKHSVKGVILLADTYENAYGESEKNLLMGVSRQIATAIENAKLNLENTAREKYKRVYIQPQF